ncbi:MAG: hypothetical protein QOG58_464 [Caballeronia sp.]|nr:hypothetical protein [Caballeronia sp.]
MAVIALQKTCQTGQARDSLGGRLLCEGATRPRTQGAKRQPCQPGRAGRYLRLALIVSFVPSLSVMSLPAPPVGIVKWTSWLKKLSVGH